MRADGGGARGPNRHSTARFTPAIHIKTYAECQDVDFICSVPRAYKNKHTCNSCPPDEMTIKLCRMKAVAMPVIVSCCTRARVRAGLRTVDGYVWSLCLWLEHDQRGQWLRKKSGEHCAKAHRESTRRKSKILRLGAFRESLMARNTRTAHLLHAQSRYACTHR